MLIAHLRKLKFAVRGGPVGRRRGTGLLRKTMAIYHCSLRTFSRANDHSAVAAAAYRAGAMLRDERTGITHRYHKRTGVTDTFILAPADAPSKFQDRAVLWNAAEASETRKNSRVAREVILALPHELSDKARAELARDMGLYLMERYRVVVDVAIHAPCEGEGHDPRNHHAHLLFTTRAITKEGFGAKTRILDDKDSGPQEVEIIREVWETLANDALARAGFEDVKIDRRTLEDQGIDRIPQTHEGKAARNAAEPSLLAKAFRQAEAEDEDEGEDGKEQGSGEKSSSSKSSSGGDSALQSKVKEDAKGRKIDYPAVDQKQTRSTFNAEIKALNEKRAAFSDKSLKDQIAQLDRVMDKLDHRLEKLQQLETKTTLKAAIKEAITGAVKLAADFLTRRLEAKETIKLTSEEKLSRTERQLSRYGRYYREGLHNQIKEMKQNIAILEQKQSEFMRYRAFIQKLEKEIATTQPSIAQNFKEQAPPKNVTNTEISLKLSLRAEMLRAHVPEQFKPPSQTKPDRQTLTTSTAVNKILQTKDEPIRLDRAAIIAPEPKPEIKPTTAFEPLKAQPEIKLQPTKAEAPPLKTAFTSKVEQEPVPKTQAEYKQPMPVKITALEKAIAERQTMKTQPKSITAKPEDRKSWFTPATDKTRPMTEAIDKAIREGLAKAPPKPETPTQNKFSKAQERQEKRAPYSEVREKTRAEAQAKRGKVDPRYRAEPYEKEEEQPKAKASTQSQGNQAKQAWAKQEKSDPETDKSTHGKTEKTKRPKMSAGFNKAAAEDTPPPHDSPEAHPEDEQDLEF